MAGPASTHERHRSAGAARVAGVRTEKDDGPGTRDRLVLAALNLFWEKGYAATGLKEILELSGVNPGSLYHFFPTKDGLLLAVLEKHEDILRERVMGEMARGRDAREKVAALFAFYRGFLTRTECALGCPMLNLAGEVGDSHPAAREKLRAMFELLRGGVKDALGARADAEELSLLIACSLRGSLAECRVTRTVGALDACERGVLRLL